MERDVETPGGKLPAAYYDFLREERRDLIRRVNRLSRLLGMSTVHADRSRQEPRRRV